MRQVPDSLYKPDGSGVREFRVSQDARYKVTDWTSFNNGAGVRTVADNLTLAEANEIASAMGKLYPGSLINPMDPPLNRGITDGKVEVQSSEQLDAQGRPAPPEDQDRPRASPGKA